MNIAFLYEHPNWSDKLVSVLQQRIHGLKPINVAELSFQTGEPCGFSAAINRINIMPSATRLPEVAFQTQHYLNWLEQNGVRILNGYRAQVTGASKVMQNAIFSTLGLAHPKGMSIYRSEDVPDAAEAIGYPVIIKPNIGGSGSGISFHGDQTALINSLANGELDLGIDGTGLVQQYIRSDGFVYRVEVLGDTLFYSIKQPIIDGQFNYCAADGCSINPAIANPITENPITENQPVQTKQDFDFCALADTKPIEIHQPADAIVQQVIRIIKTAGADFGGVEYFIDQETGQPCFYDINPYSNFVSDGEALLGFSPEERFADFVCQALDLS